MLSIQAQGNPVGTVALLHGNGLHPGFYEPLLNALAARGLHGHALPLPGFAGRASSRPDWPSWLEAIEADLHPVLGAHGTLIGHSLGGLAALLLAARRPPRALVLLEPAVIPCRSLAQVGALLYRAKASRDAPDHVPNRGPWFWRMHRPDAMPAHVIRAVLEAGQHTDVALLDALQRQLPSIYPLPFDAVRCPTLVVRGGASGPVMAWGQRDLYRRLPAATAVVIDGAGHWLANEQDAAVADAIAVFVGEVR